LDAVPQKEPNPILVYSGRLKPAKRPDHAIKAFKILKIKFPNAELWILGDGPFKDELEHMACEGVRFFGYLDNIKRRELLMKSWVLVNPSVREGWGLNVIEANALGTPCVVYNLAGLKDAVQDHQNGLLAKAGDIEDLAQKIGLLFTDQSLRMELSRKALDTSRTFSWDNSANEFMKIIKDMNP